MSICTIQYTYCTYICCKYTFKMHNTQYDVRDEIVSLLKKGDRESIAQSSGMSINTVKAVLAKKFNNDKVIEACAELLKSRIDQIKTVLDKI